MGVLSVEIFLAYLLDLILGDPRWLPHPVRGIGYAITQTERFLRRLKIAERLAGVILTVFIVGGIFLISTGLVNLAHFLHPTLGTGLSIVLIFTTLSVKSLYQESMKVYWALQKGDLLKARKDLAMIVGRDTENLDFVEIVRAGVETVAENTVDGVISPLFFAFLGGAPLALTYKAINTLDSMVGYRNEKYLRFGWASARLDDIANFIPARIAGILMPLAAFLCGERGFEALKIVLRDGQKHPSPNSGISEAAVAGALGVQLGGLNFYQGKPSLKPTLGDSTRSLTLEDIYRANRIMLVTSGLTLTLGLLCRW
ncbi:MAG TPA: adenosylcobinamide-phosphate synthase CbiB [Candidatus Limnocylindrales bacterium]|nr:adenosylcobinamide-phosphate synthase CbiB [Candidatus Limnocylindrales bacterium]